jgi:hypothetical protein
MTITDCGGKKSANDRNVVSVTCRDFFSTTINFAASRGVTGVCAIADGGTLKPYGRSADGSDDFVFIETGRV